MTRYEAHIEKSWQEVGLAHVVVARFREDGSADFGIFLVDLLCLGVKECFGDRQVSAFEVRELIDERLPPGSHETIHPACAKKLIEGALAYAQALGFAPHREFRKIRKVLSGLDASMCPTEFIYGKDGRPCYVRGSDDDDTRVQRILRILEARCGIDGFTYEDPSDGEPDEADDDDWQRVREDLLAWLEAEPPEVPRFYEFSGLITGLLLCPKVASPLQVMGELWGPEGPTWESEVEAQEFTGLLMDYWNMVNTMILDSTAPECHPDSRAVDIWIEDLPEDDGMALAMASYAWANGFMRATRIQPKSWGTALTRADLKPHWDMVRWWSELDREKSRNAMITAVESDPSRTLNGAVTALARALRASPES